MFANSRRLVIAVVTLGACSLAGAGCSSSNSPGVGNTGSGGAPAGTGGSSASGLPSDAGDAGPASDLAKPGPYAVGHVSYMLSDSSVYARPVAVSVWYPVDAATITPATVPAQYPLDPYTTKLPVSTSTDWEALGYDRAYEGPTPSSSSPFPLLVLSVGYSCDNWEYLYIGTRLASHGFVVAITDHDRDGQYLWSSSDDMIVTLFNRTRDVSFAITVLLQKNDTVGESLHGVIDPSKIAMSGHSIGGYATLALAGGDDNVCDASQAAGNTEPQFACVASPPDPCIKAIVTLDPSSWGMRYHEMARISVPNLIIGETVEHNLSYNPWNEPEAARDNARPHAAINRSDSYRVNVTMANHISFTNGCDGSKVMSSLGVDATTLPNIYGPNTNSSWPCGTYGNFDPTTNPATREIVTTYMLAFLKTYFGRENDAWMLTSDYAAQNQPLVEFFDSEQCDAPLPIDASLPSQDYYTYQPHPGECVTAQKDPADYFAPLVSDGGAP